jgi:hypothetical protein
VRRHRVLDLIVLVENVLKLQLAGHHDDGFQQRPRHHLKGVIVGEEHGKALILMYFFKLKHKIIFI